MGKYQYKEYYSNGTVREFDTIGELEHWLRERIKQGKTDCFGRLSKDGQHWDDFVSHRPTHLRLDIDSEGE